MSDPDRSASLAHTDRARIVFAPGFWPTAAQQRRDAIEAFTARYEVGRTKRAKEFRQLEYANF